MKKTISLSIVLFISLYSSPGFSDSLCYRVNQFPAVAMLSADETAIRFSTIGRDNSFDSRVAPFFEYDINRNIWRKTESPKCTYGNCPTETSSCREQIPKINMSVAEFKTLRSIDYEPSHIDQKVTACHKVDNEIFFGIGFYAGEGTNGVGGVGKYSITTGEVEIRRPKVLRNTSITHVAFDGLYLWVATANDHECSGNVPSERLVQYNWYGDQALQYDLNATKNFCGFVSYGMFLHNYNLWVASDMGISVLKGKKLPTDRFPKWERTWTHYIPSSESSQFVKSVSCDDLYVELLLTVTNDGDAASVSSEYLLENNLIRFERDTLVRIIKNLAKTGKGL